MNNTLPCFYSVIPANVRYDKRLNAQEKLFFSEISALTNLYGYCFASNKYFANLYNCDKRTIIRWISKLEQLQYIKCVNITSKENQITERRIFLSETLLGGDIFVTTPHDRNVTHNNIDINKTHTSKKKFLDTIHLSDEEYKKLIEEYGEVVTTKCIEELELYKKSKNINYYDDYSTIKRWVIHRIKELEEKEKKKETISKIQKNKKNSYNSYEQRQYPEGFLDSLYANK